MSAPNVLDFLRVLAARPDLLDDLKTRSKDEVVAAAALNGMPFEESEFDALVWELEVQLAAKRGEAFDQHFALWRTMWGQYYLEYLVVDVLPSLGEAGIDPGTTVSGH